MYAGTFTASMKNTNFKLYTENKQRHLKQNTSAPLHTAQALSPTSHFSNKQQSQNMSH